MITKLLLYKPVEHLYILVSFAAVLQFFAALLQKLKL